MVNLSIYMYLLWRICARALRTQLIIFKYIATTQVAFQMIYMIQVCIKRTAKHREQHLLWLQYTGRGPSTPNTLKLPLAPTVNPEK